MTLPKQAVQQWKAVLSLVYRDIESHRGTEPFGECEVDGLLQAVEEQLQLGHKVLKRIMNLLEPT